MNESDLVRLRHMRDAAREAMSFIHGRTGDDRRGDRVLLLALVKEIEIIGEAASRISPETRAQTPQKRIFRLGPGDQDRIRGLKGGLKWGFAPIPAESHFF